MEFSGTHWTRAEQQKLDTVEKLLYSGHVDENDPYTKGAVLILSTEARKALMECESHEPRVIKTSFKTKKQGITMNVIQCYAPINDSNGDSKDQFYERLQSVIANFPGKDLAILMGALNAKVGMEDTGYEDIMG
ncbi:unnamed protein product [Schistosoma curassoni]|uniref:Craniofacial development protein 2-like n=1 Tax=Schistosoma curassoni TaxID=6186 RepID=A0A183K8E2_9TREM|nr:unnamed protein product [Schistosoma curassoni]